MTDGDTAWDNPRYMDFDEPEAPPAKKSRYAQNKKQEESTDVKAIIPRLPERELAITSDEIKRGVSERDRAATNLKLDGFSYMEIAEMLEFPDARTAKRAVERVLAATHSNEDYETLRLVAAARAEQLFRRSLAMASADFLIDHETNERIPNTEKLRWHQQASVDLMNHATITGAKAPSKHEITPGEGAFDQIVDRILQISGHEDIMDAEVIDLEYIPLPPADDLGVEGGD